MYWEFATIAFAILTLVVAVQWRKAKRLLAETAEALTVISAAIHDDTLSEQEWTQIVDELNDVVLTAQDLFNPQGVGHDRPRHLNRNQGHGNRKSNDYPQIS